MKLYFLLLITTFCLCKFCTARQMGSITGKVLDKVTLLGLAQVYIQVQANHGALHVPISYRVKLWSKINPEIYDTINQK